MTGITDKELDQLLRDAQERADSYPFDDHILEVVIPALVAEVRHHRAAIARIQALADAWTARGEHDMAYSKTSTDENIADYLLGAGAELVEKARHIHTALHPDEETHDA